MPIALRRHSRGCLAQHRTRTRRDNNRRAGMARGDGAVHIVSVEGAVTVLSALAPGGGYQSSWGTLLLVLGGMKRDAVPGMSIDGHQASV
jgi:hypothetical protein